MKTYTVTPHYDGNDSFEVEADTLEAAQTEALNALGWSVSEQKEEE